MNGGLNNRLNHKHNYKHNPSNNERHFNKYNNYNVNKNYYKQKTYVNNSNKNFNVHNNSIDNGIKDNPKQLVNDNYTNEDNLKNDAIFTINTPQETVSTDNERVAIASENKSFEILENNCRKNESVVKTQPIDTKDTEIRDKNEQIINNNLDDIVKSNTLSSSKIRGMAIFNETLVSYIYDTGSDITLVTKSLFDKIKRDYEYSRIHKYDGYPLKSFTGDVKIIGECTLDKCLFNEVILQNIKILVVDDQSTKINCIVGIDIMKQIPEFNNLLKETHTVINEMSRNVIKTYESVKKHEI